MSNKEEYDLPTKLKINAEIKRCGCECHKVGVDIMHFMACCEATYMKPFQISEKDTLGMIV